LGGGINGLGTPPPKKTYGKKPKLKKYPGKKAHGKSPRKKSPKKYIIHNVFTFINIYIF